MAQNLNYPAMRCRLDSAFEVKVVGNYRFGLNEGKEGIRNNDIRNSLQNRFSPFNKHSSYWRGSILFFPTTRYSLHFRICQNIFTKNGLHIALKISKFLNRSINEKFKIIKKSLNVDQARRRKTFWRKVIQQINVFLFLFHIWKKNGRFICDLRILLLEESQNREQCSVRNHCSWTHWQLTHRCETGVFS